MQCGSPNHFSSPHTVRTSWGITVITHMFRPSRGTVREADSVCDFEPLTFPIQSRPVAGRSSTIPPSCRELSSLVRSTRIESQVPGGPRSRLLGSAVTLPFALASGGYHDNLPRNLTRDCDHASPVSENLQVGATSSVESAASHGATVSPACTVWHSGSGTVAARRRCLPMNFKLTRMTRMPSSWHCRRSLSIRAVTRRLLRHAIQLSSCRDSFGPLESLIKFGRRHWHYQSGGSVLRPNRWRTASVTGGLTRSLRVGPSQ